MIHPWAGQRSASIFRRYEAPVVAVEVRGCDRLRRSRTLVPEQRPANLEGGNPPSAVFIYAKWAETRQSCPTRFICNFLQGWVLPGVGEV